MSANMPVKKSEFLNDCVTVVCLIEAVNSNPNGDPDNENAPRQYSDGRGYITPECAKFKIRQAIGQMVENEELKEEGHHLYCTPQTFSIQSEVEACLGKDVMKKKNITLDEEIAYRKQLCDYFFDARMFGMVNTAFSSYNTLGKISGALQIGTAVSCDPVEIVPDTITRCCVTKDDERKSATKNKDRTMGRRKVVRYGLYRQFTSTNIAAARMNNVTNEDVHTLIQAYLRMFDDDMSSARPEMAIRKLYTIRQSSKGCKLPPYVINDVLVTKLKPGVDSPTCYDDYIVEFKRDMLPDTVEVMEYDYLHPEGVIL